MFELKCESYWMVEEKKNAVLDDDDGSAFVFRANQVEQFGIEQGEMPLLSWCMHGWGQKRLWVICCWCNGMSTVCADMLALWDDRRQNSWDSWHFSMQIVFLWDHPMMIMEEEIWSAAYSYVALRLSSFLQRVGQKEWSWMCMNDDDDGSWLWFYPAT